MVNVATVSANTVNAYVVDGTIEAANRINRDYLKALEAQAETKTVSGADVYAKILALRAEFIKVNGTPGTGEDDAEIPASYIEPTAMFVSPKVMAELKRQNLILYKDNDPMGSFLEMAIIEAPNLTNDVVMLNKVAMISGISFNAVKTFDASVLGYADGVAYIGEIAYVNKATELGTDTVCKPVMAVASL